MKKVNRLENFRMHSCYLSPSTWEAVIMGDRQVTYGILWHLWQFAQEIENRNRKREHVSSSVMPDEILQESSQAESRESMKHPTLPKVDTKLTTKKSIQRKNLSSKVCPILIDIPAAVLASEQHPRSRSAILGLDCRGVFASPDLRSLWEDDHPPEHDLYPQPSTAPRIAESTTIESELPLASHQEAATAHVEESGPRDTSYSTLDSSQDASQVMEDTVAESDSKLEDADRMLEEEPDVAVDSVSPAEPVLCDDGRFAFFLSLALLMRMNLMTFLYRVPGTTNQGIRSRRNVYTAARD